MVFDKLYSIVEKEIGSKSRRDSQKTEIVHANLISNKEVRSILEIQKPIIDNVSDSLELERGKVYAVRQDTSYGLTGFKQPVIASLILKTLIDSVKRKEYNKKWIDGGNVNSSLALAYFAKKFGGDATYIMSRFFPKYILNYIKKVSHNSIQLIKAPNLKLGIERDFYQHLVNLVRNDVNFKDYQPLWHAKYGGQYSTFLGIDLIKAIEEVPDFIVSVIGAGSTIEGQAIPIKKHFKNIPKIVVPEHNKSSLLKKKKSKIHILNDIIKDAVFDSIWFSQPPKGIPHYVIGPHYDEINPLIKSKVINQIDYSFRYDDFDWKSTSLRCYLNDLEIGNSSAANLFVSKQLAEKGYNVLTFIYEPFREFYQGYNIEGQNTIIDLLNNVTLADK
ncbi:MAG: hypothetical protein DWQ02_27525 [Bacteroidetes bacterium]|nr:MAG: hypothetical protein DWQ02_27525 [Bacteroidota bacterium]